MSARLRGIARGTETVVEAGRYRDAAGQDVSIERAVTAALSGTRLYGPDPVPVAALDTDRVPRTEVTGESRLAAARRPTAETAGRAAVLSYASARNPGGGYVDGAQALGEAGRRDARRAGGLDRGRLRSCDELPAAGARVASGLRKRVRTRVSAVSTSAWAGVAPLPLVRTGSWPGPTGQAAIGEHVSSPEIWSDRSSKAPGQGAEKYAWAVPPCDAPVKKIIRETGIRCAAF